jgi:hypothetical protein
MTAEVTVRVDREDGTSEDVVLTLDLQRLTMRESVRLEEILGPDTFGSLADGLRQGDTISPRIVQGLLYVKLKSSHPEVTLDSFDVDLEELQRALDGEEPPAPLEEPSGDGS